MRENNVDLSVPSHICMVAYNYVCLTSLCCFQILQTGSGRNALKLDLMGHFRLSWHYYQRFKSVEKLHAEFPDRVAYQHMTIKYRALGFRWAFDKLDLVAFFPISSCRSQRLPNAVGMSIENNVNPQGRAKRCRRDHCKTLGLHSSTHSGQKHVQTKQVV